MASRIYTVTVDAKDPGLLADFWRETLGFQRSDDDDDDPDEVYLEPPSEAHPALLFVRVDDPKNAKNRLHFDLMPDNQDDEVERLMRLGARRVDIGQRDVSWVVLADPEGNEFCVLSESDD